MSTEQLAADRRRRAGWSASAGGGSRRSSASPRQLFGERGYDAVSLEDVADRLDVTKGSLYYYFASKDELATAAIETLGNDVDGAARELPAGRVGDARRPAAAARARAAGHRRARVPGRAAAVPRAARLAGRPAGAHQGAAPPARPVFRTVVEEGVAAGEFTVTGVDTDAAVHARGDDAGARLVPRPAGRGARRAVDGLADTLMMLVGTRPAGR